MVARSIVRTPTSSQSPAGARYWNVERIPFDSTIAARRTVTLTHTPLAQSGIVLIPSGGIEQRPGTDFRLVEPKTIAWNNESDGLYSVLAATDSLLVMYHS